MGRLNQVKQEMSLTLAPVMALCAVIVLNLGTAPSWGFYAPLGFVAVVVAFGFGVAACVAHLKAASAKVAGSLPALTSLTAAAACMLGFTGRYYLQLYYLDDSIFAHDLPIVFDLSLATTSALFIVIAIQDWLQSHRDYRQLACLAEARLPLPVESVRRAAILSALLFLGFSVRFFVIEATPDPVIDVYNLLRDGADHIIAGRNPYTNDIISPYGTEKADLYGLTDPADPRPAGYPPLPLLVSVAPGLFGGDVRWANVVAELVAAATIALVGFRRGRAMLGLLVTAIYLNLPRMPFIIEQAWYEPVIAALFGVGLMLSEYTGRTKSTGYVLLGLGLTAKQFGLPLLFPLAWAHRRSWRSILLGLAIGGIVMLPWVIWSPRDFFDIILWKHLARPLQTQSITVSSFMLNEFDIVVPRIVGWLAAGVSLLVISAMTPRNGAATALGLGTALLAFCIFHTQGFPNYFYLVQYLWLLGCVGLLPPRATTVAGQKESSSE